MRAIWNEILYKDVVYKVIPSDDDIACKMIFVDPNLLRISKQMRSLLISCILCIIIEQFVESLSAFVKEAFFRELSNSLS